MTTLKNFKVSLDPAERKNGFWTITYSIGQAGPSKNILVKNLDELRQEITAFAAEYGKPCHAHVKCLEKRKPAGFDKAFDFHSLFFNEDAA